MMSTLRFRLGTRLADRLFAYGMLAPAVVVLAGLNLYPAATAVQSSLFRIHSVTREATFTGLGNYAVVLGDPLFWGSLGRSLVWTVPGVAVQLALGIVFSLVLHQELRGRWLARGLVLFPYLVPAIVAALIWRFMFNPLTGIVNYLLVDVARVLRQPIAWLSDPSMAMLAVLIVGIWKYVPFMVILFLARLQTTPLELYDSAKIDGANPWQELWHITLPWLLPTILVALLLRTFWMFNEFDIVYLLAFGGPTYATTTLPVLIRTTAFDLQELGKAATISMLTVVVLIGFALVYLRSYGRAEEQLTS